MLNLEQCKIIYLNDFTNYNNKFCNNGGCYGFWTEFENLHNGNWKVSYGTTAEFNYCPVCGQFNAHYDEDSWCDSKYSCGEYTIISTRGLEEKIALFKTNKQFTEEIMIKNDRRHYIPGELYIEYMKPESETDNTDEDLSISVD